jgi:hypothetical protein
VTNEPNRRRLTAAFEPRSVALDGRPTDTAGSPAADPNVRERDPTGCCEELVFCGTRSSFRGWLVRTGGVEPPQHEAAGLQPVELANALRPQGGVTDRTRTGTARLTTSGARRYTTATMSGDDRTRTGNLSPDKRALSTAELRPREGKKGARGGNMVSPTLKRCALLS